MPSNHAVRIIAVNRAGMLRDIGALCAENNANINLIQLSCPTGAADDIAGVDMELDYSGDIAALTEKLGRIAGVYEVKTHNTSGEIFGKRVIVIGGGAQVAQVAMGAVNEADRHNIRGERISVDTIPLVGEANLANAVEAVISLPRTAILVLAGSLMGGDITQSIKKVQAAGIPVICLNMAGTAAKAADLIVTDPIQAGVMAVMHVSTIGVFDINRVRGRQY
ncbi:MAG TPA: DUF5612 domain-containing protein [Methanocorpusculum sp.]|nr:DUF5612 domain-containing protein [Methanocorpusculum sp.]